MKKHRVNPAVLISAITDTLTEPISGRGIIGFVVTYPNGSISNHLCHYTREDHEIVRKVIVTKHEEFVKYHQSTSGFQQNSQDSIIAPENWQPSDNN